MKYNILIVFMLALGILSCNTKTNNEVGIEAPAEITQFKIINETNESVKGTTLVLFPIITYKLSVSCCNRLDLQNKKNRNNKTIRTNKFVVQFSPNSKKPARTIMTSGIMIKHTHL